MVAFNFRNHKKTGLNELNLIKNRMANKPETIIFQTKCNYSCVYYEKNYRSNLGDCITSLAGIKSIPKL